MFKFLFSFVLLIGISAKGEVVEFPQEELARETVLPVFEKKIAVKNRNIELEGRLEGGLFAGASLNEAFYNPLMFGLSTTYHINEISGINFQYITWSGGLSSYGKQLKKGDGIDFPFDATKAPFAESMYLLNYEHSAYYGKISLSKSIVFNLSLYGLMGVGQISFGDESNLVFNLGLGQKIYFGKNLALRFDLNVYTYEGPDPTSLSLDPSGPSYDSGDFKSRRYFNQTLAAGVVGLF